MTAGRAIAAVAAVGAATCLPIAPASGQSSTRTSLVSLGINGTLSDGPSSRPTISGDGRYVVFDSAATNLALDLNGSVRDVFITDVRFNATGLVSSGLGGAGADGPSTSPVLAAKAPVVAFESDATNLVEGDANGAGDIFVRTGNGPVIRVTAAHDGTPANGRSRDPDISSDGRFVVFSSAASNLVGGDVNGFEDIFVRDLLTGSMRRVTGPESAEPDGPSRAPAISPDGRYVSFSSAATNLVERDTNGVMDVFVVDLRSGGLDRVSVSSRGRQQNAAVEPPFVPISDISRNGTHVAFDSDASNLVRRDLNRDTDVFVHTRLRSRRSTFRVSVDMYGREGDNDSFFPTISPNGRFIAFESFSKRLAPGDGAGEDVFVWDFYTFAPSVLAVSRRGAKRGREYVEQLLQRPQISDTGRHAVFTSTAGNLVEDDGNRVEDVFRRELRTPRARFRRAPARVGASARPRYELAAGVRGARFVCELDGLRIQCPRKGRLPTLSDGAHTLTVRAGAPGMLYQTRPLVRRFRVG